MLSLHAVRRGGLLVDPLQGPSPLGLRDACYTGDWRPKRFAWT
jgi:hypothetical protein